MSGAYPCSFAIRAIAPAMTHFALIDAVEPDTASFAITQGQQWL